MPCGTRDTARVLQVLTYGAITLYGQTFQPVLLTIHIPHCGPTTPEGKPSGLGCSHFARRYFENHFCFLFLRVLRCFSSPGSPLQPMYSAADTWTLLQVGFPIRKSPDQSLFAAPRGLSQLATSFIAFRCQGIHRLPLVA